VHRIGRQTNTDVKGEKKQLFVYRMSHRRHHRGAPWNPELLNAAVATTPLGPALPAALAPAEPQPAAPATS
jgi:hypothetical protein